MKKKATYCVMFRGCADKLTSMFIEKYHSVEAAKAAILADADCFANCHKYRGGPVGMKFRQKAKWVNPESEDYYFVQGQDGCKCYWQYFKI